jgi:hypothetical protein
VVVAMQTLRRLRAEPMHLAGSYSPIEEEDEDR